MKFLIGILLMGVVFSKQERCFRNERYVRCGTACPLTCDNLENPPDSCGTFCILGCQCEEGFVQSKGLGCLKPEYCPKSRVRKICLDPPDEGFCGGRKMMWNFNQSTGTCHQFMFRGCGGNGNRYKTEEECLEKCKGDVCGENEHYKECSTFCPLTCENYEKPPKICPAMCYTGCVCKEGFLRRTDGKCVRPEQCQDKQVSPLTVVIKDSQGQRLKNLAGPYDEGDFLFLVCEAGGGNTPPIVTWWRKGVLIDDTYFQTSQGLSRNQMALSLQRSDFMEELTCQASNGNLMESINASVQIDLNMKPLYVRITTPQKPANLGEVLSLDCETSGSRPEAKIVWSIGDELVQNENQTFFSRRNGLEGNITYSSFDLKPGIDDNGKVIICKAENPALPHIDMRDTWILNIHYNVCGKNELYNECGTNCPRTCENYDIKVDICDQVCNEGCECENGFVRRDDGRCVRPEQCQNKQNKIPINCTDCPDPGFCDASMLRFYYDSEEERCKEFLFGGCGGNTNNFEREEDCKATCGNHP